MLEDLLDLTVELEDEKSCQSCPHLRCHPNPSQGCLVLLLPESLVPLRLEALEEEHWEDLSKEQFSEKPSDEIVVMSESEVLDFLVALDLRKMTKVPAAV